MSKIHVPESSPPFHATCGRCHKRINRNEKYRDSGSTSPGTHYHEGCVPVAEPVEDSTVFDADLDNPPADPPTGPAELVEPVKESAHDKFDFPGDEPRDTQGEPDQERVKTHGKAHGSRTGQMRAR